MPKKKKKKFLNKKESVSFALIHRSVEDPATGGLEQQGGYLLQPTHVPEHVDPTQLDKIVPGDLLAPDDLPPPATGGRLGLLLKDLAKTEQDKEGKEKTSSEAKISGDYDYNKHLKTIGGGVLINADVDLTASKLRALPPKAERVEEKYDLATIEKFQIKSEDDEKVGKKSKKITVEVKTKGKKKKQSEAEDDLRASLEGQDGFEELNDDFFSQAQGLEMETAMEMGLHVEKGEGEEGGDDDDDLVEIGEDEDDVKGDEIEEEELELGDEDEKEIPKAVKEALKKKMAEKAKEREKGKGKEQEKEDLRPKRDFDDHFETVLRQYGDDDEEEEEPDELPAKVSEKEFLETIDEFTSGEKVYKPGKDAPTKLATPVDKEAVSKYLKKAIKEELDDTASINSAIDSMFARVIKEQWDCESILSKCSNLENHPTLIMEPRRPTPEKTIKLSKKTGIPLGVLPEKAKKEKEEKEEESDEEDPKNLGEARDKHEGADKRKARKAAVKQQRRQNRQRKKALKTVYGQESSQLKEQRLRNKGQNPAALHF